MQIPPLTLGRFPAIRGRDWLYLFVSIAGSLAYFLTIPWHPFIGMALVKSLGVAALALLVLHRLKDLEGLILGAGLVFSVAGDVFLAIDPQRTFIFGLISFLIAHLFYIMLFVGRAQRRRGPVSRVALVLSVLLVVYSVLMMVWLWPSLGALAIPVLIYIAIITIMGVTSLVAGFPEPWVPLGAILFIFSDSVIAITRFKEMWLAAGPWLIWSMYYIGQYLIAMGFLRIKFLHDSGDVAEASQPAIG